MDWNVVVFPAYYLEAVAFHPPAQPASRVAREIASRVIALVAPIFYAYQTALCGLAIAIDVPLACCCFLSSGISLFVTIPNAEYSGRNFLSSLLEIPEKLIFGPHCSPNYVGDGRRYQRMNQLAERIELT